MSYREADVVIILVSGREKRVKQKLVLLVNLPQMLKPTGKVASLRVFVRPVNHAALAVPFIFAIKRDGIAHFERMDARRKVNVVGNEQGLP